MTFPRVKPEARHFPSSFRLGGIRKPEATRKQRDFQLKAMPLKDLSLVGKPEPKLRRQINQKEEDRI